MLLAMIEPAADASAAEWLTRSAGAFGTVHSLVPDVFEAYARVFQPASRYGETRDPGHAPAEGREVRWADVAAANGTKMHGAAEWGQLTGSWALEEQADLWDRTPETRQLPEGPARRLAEILARHTRTPERCRFAVWDGWGESMLVFMFRKGVPPEEQARIRERREAEIEAWESLVRGAPKFGMPSRAYHLLEGPIHAIMRFYDASHKNPPSIWWPEDRVWCVGGDVDLMSTYVGGGAATIEAVLADPALEALPIPAGQSVTWEADTINPPVGPPR